MYARGVFEPTQHLVLVAENSEGVVVGMDMTFSGFPIGRVRRVELGADGNVRIVVDVPQKEAHWLRTTSVFTLVRGLVGGTNLRAYSGILTDPPLPDGAVRTVLRRRCHGRSAAPDRVGPRAAAEPERDHRRRLAAQREPRRRADAHREAARVRGAPRRAAGQRHSSAQRCC